MATRSTTRKSLDRDAVVAGAVALVDTEGLDALTIRRLATDLGVTPMAMYWHFENKDSLLDAVIGSLYRDVVLPEATGAWDEDLRACLAALIAALRPHPALAPLAQSRVFGSEGGLRLSELALGLLKEAGFPQEEVGQIGGYLLGSTVTLITSEPGAHGTSPMEREAAERAKRATLLTLSPRDYPNVVACADDLSSLPDPEPYYARGLDLLIAGVRGLQP